MHDVGISRMVDYQTTSGVATLPSSPDVVMLTFFQGSDRWSLE
jgi:hypothetical protein